MKKDIYINSVKQISAQQPLTDEWFDNPILYNEQYIRAIDADYKQYFSPLKTRRLGKILKRALLTSREAMQESGVSNPDAIITGTGLGCIENTEIFLDKLVREGEEMLNPTHFMNSTHNTISSLVAIDAKCRNYNTTYAHKGMSFECALQDAFLQMQSGKIGTALVGAHDEMTLSYFTLLKKMGHFGVENQIFAGETAVAMILSTEKTEKSLCRIEAMGKVYSGDKGCPDIEGLKKLIERIDFVMIGSNGSPENDRIYLKNCQKLFPDIPLLQYKNIFGESYTAPAFAVYAAALCLKNRHIPKFLSVLGTQYAVPNKILIYNHFKNKNHSFIILSRQP